MGPMHISPHSAAPPPRSDARAEGPLATAAPRRAVHAPAPKSPGRARSLAWSQRTLVSGASLLCVLLAWYLVTGPLGLLSAMQLPSPADAWSALVELANEGYADGTLLQHVLSSSGLVLYGFVVAVATGIPLGVLMGRSPRVEAFVNPIFQVIRPIAPIAWIPLTILWFGLGINAKVFVIWLAAFAPTVINTYTGVRHIDPNLLQAARVNGVNAWQMLVDVVLPGALPSIFTGMRTSLQACWMVLVAAELVGSFMGLGHVLIIATVDLNSGMILVAMAAIAVMGMLMTLILTLIEHKVMPWKA